MIGSDRDRVDYDEHGSGSTVVLVPGSCSTGAAWRPVIAACEAEFRWVTTSLLGYGGTAERRTRDDPSMSYEIEALESVIRNTGGPVHLVGHSFGGLVALAVALRGQVSLTSLTIGEAPAAELLRERGEVHHYGAFREMTDAYCADFADGNREAIAAMIDFYGGQGTFASWPQKVRSYAIETTSTNVLDWASAYGYPLTAALLTALKLPTLLFWGETSHPSVQQANVLLAQCINGSTVATIAGAAHFMIATHAQGVARAITHHVHRTSQLTQ